MAKIDKLLNKTVRDGEAKKWVVVVGIVVGVLIAFVSLYGLYSITETLIPKSNGDPQNIEYTYIFYNQKVGLNETAVYIIGSSLTCFEIYTPVIDEKLKNNGYNISTYSLFVEADTPRLRALQIKELIESKPSLVIYGVSYRTITTNEIHQGRTLNALSHIEFTDELKQLYTNSELINLNYGSFYQKGYVLSNIKTILLNDNKEKTTQIISPERSIDLAKDSYSGFVKLRSNETKDMDSIKEGIENPQNSWRPIVKNEDDKTKQAFRYIINELNEAEIPVIIINMPIAPVLQEKITDESRQNFYDFINNTGVIWIDMEHKYNDSHFYDYVHATWNGALDFSDEVADLIIEQVENDVIHYT